jgi:hypothetical protein
MNIFISYSHKDRDYAESISKKLLEVGYSVSSTSNEMHVGDNIIEKVTAGIKDADAYILLISRNSVNSEWVMKEQTVIALSQLPKIKKRTLPVLIDKVSPPSFLHSNLFFDMSDNFDKRLEELVGYIKKIVESQGISNLSTKDDYTSLNNKAILELKRALEKGKLTLVCGAGVSIGAGIPSWENLLNNLLERALNSLSDSHDIKLKENTVNELYRNYKTSSIILGKYLKTNLGKEFNDELRSALYKDQLSSSDTLDAIVELSRPKRDKKPLDSIITFNFDSLIEENLAKNNIKFKEIYSEGINNEISEIPIYHVHGYLPKDSEIPINTEIVFSEDSYHTQFIDPFSWSNLILLSKFSQNTCLFVGLSMNDPNLRRLLDVANRKNPDKKLKHYIIKKIPKLSEDEDILNKVALLLEEQDVMELGLNMIWIEDFEEIPKILLKINS